MPELKFTQKEQNINNKHDTSWVIKILKETQLLWLYAFAPFNAMKNAISWLQALLR